MTRRAGAFLTVAATLLLLAPWPARAHELTGTWSGTVTVDGQPTDFTVTFSENGYFLYTYTTDAGLVRIVELSGPGQIRFVPPGGGLMTLQVESVVTRPDGVAYVMHTGFEGIRNGQPDRQYVAEEADYAVTPAGLRVRIVSRATSFLGDRGGGSGPRATRVVEGLLKKRS
jgi:hypothetical protein